MTYVTLGGVTVGICILIHYLVQWWPGLKSLRADPARQLGALLPFLLAWCYGCLIVLGVGGIIGWTGRAARWISNWLGDVSLVWGVGGQTGQVASRAIYLPLTQTGAAIVLILTVAMVAAVKKSRYGRDIKRGVWCGICLGTSAGVAGFAAVPLAQAANWLGLTVYGAVA
jgi:predicted membrane protein